LSCSVSLSISRTYISTSRFSLTKSIFEIHNRLVVAAVGGKLQTNSLALEPFSIACTKYKNLSSLEKVWFSCIFLNKSQNCNQSLNSPLNFGNSSAAYMHVHCLCKFAPIVRLELRLLTEYDLLYCILQPWLNDT